MTRQDLIKEARRLTAPRPFEPDYQRHLARIAEDRQARDRLAAAGFYTLDQIHQLAQEA